MYYDYFAAVDADGVVRRQLRRAVPNDGPSLPDDGMTYYPLDEPIDWAAQPSPTSELLRSADGGMVWSERATIEQRRGEAIEAIDACCEALRLSVISKMTQAEEYKLAEQHAREYRAAGYTGEAGRGVTGWTRAKHRQEWTDRDAADDILATADRWYSLLFDIRDARLAAKEDVRHETEVAAIVAGVQAHMESLALQMNTTITE